MSKTAIDSFWSASPIEDHIDGNVWIICLVVSADILGEVWVRRYTVVLDEINMHGDDDGPGYTLGLACERLRSVALRDLGEPLARFWPFTKPKHVSRYGYYHGGYDW